MDKLRYERELCAKGYNFVCGVDEVGRGPLAGPVVCAAVIMPSDGLIDGVDDSKKLSQKKREKLDVLIRQKAVAYAICCVEPQIIDEVNILEATKFCMLNAVKNLKVKPDFIMTDGNMTLDTDIPQTSIVKGDSLSYTIGCASIIAKVYRDGLMVRLAQTYPEYGFERNMGYGTPEHIKAIIEAGICPVHRRSFTKKWQ